MKVKAVHMRLFLLACQSVMCTLLLAAPQGHERASAKAFKGVELYSWRDSEGAWLFALLPGTNRIKAEAEIKKMENRISGVKELEERFLRLAEGEQVVFSANKTGMVSTPAKFNLEDLKATLNSLHTTFRCQHGPHVPQETNQLIEQLLNGAKSQPKSRSRNS